MNENKVVAIVKGKEITQQDVLQFLNDLGPQTAMQFQSPEGMKRVVDELVNQEVLYLDAIENGLNEEKEFKEELEKIKINFLKQYAFRKIISDISATEGEILEFYNEHKEHFQKPESVRASHILVDSEDKANEVLKEISEGLDFEEAARKYSLCPSKDKGGDLGEFTRGQMVVEFEEAAFSMEIDTISEPVRSQFGYHIIKLISKNEASISKLDEVKNQITQQIIGTKQQEVYLNKTEDLKNKYEAKINL